MPHRALTAVLLAVLTVAGCRSEAVTLGFAPEIGARYSYQYEISGTITTIVDGEDPEVTELQTTLSADQQVISASEAGVVVEVVLRRDGGATRTAVVLLDRAGSLRGIHEIEDLPATTFALPAAGSALASELVAPPAGPLVLGQRWSLREGAVSVEARLRRFGVVDGARVAGVTATVEEAIDQTTAVTGSLVTQRGTLRSDAETTFDLADGSIRQADTHTTGTVRATIEPPLDIVAPPVEAEVRYDLSVRVRRTA